MDSIDHTLPSCLICPTLRTRFLKNPRHRKIDESYYILVENSYYMSNAEDDETLGSHHLLPLYWCNNKETEVRFRDKESGLPCLACGHDTIGTIYYFCEECDRWYHKECVESPHMLKSPYHPKHSLQLYKYDNGALESSKLECHSCRSPGTGLFYHCSICDFNLDPVCVRKPPFINHPKKHEHTLYLYPRKSVSICDLCGLNDNKSIVFVCLHCDFFVHKNCIYLPHVIKISRHKHRISFVYSLPSNEWHTTKKKWYCGVCRQNIDGTYGAYSCTKKGCLYVVHSKCATNRPFVWDGIELEGVPEEVKESIKPPFEDISDGIILHFSHSHPMRLEEDIKILYDENKLCQACMLPPYDGNAYTCMRTECDYVLHEKCAYLPRVKQHALHAHPLILKPSTQTYIFCQLCFSCFFGFNYVCSKGCDHFHLDALCASTFEPYYHHSHWHPLFITNSTNRCSICDTKVSSTLNCDKCGFVLCYSCATLPSKVRYKTDEHLLTLSYEKGANGIYWCDLCEETMNPRTGFYRCNDCKVTIHIECLLGDDIYMDPSSRFTIGRKEFDIVQNNALTRPICNECGRRCQYRMMFIASSGDIYCSIRHIVSYLKSTL